MLGYGLLGSQGRGCFSCYHLCHDVFEMKSCTSFHFVKSCAHFFLKILYMICLYLGLGNKIRVGWIFGFKFA